MKEYRIGIDRVRVGIQIRLEQKWVDHPFLFNSFRIKNQKQINQLKQQTEKQSKEPDLSKLVDLPSRDNSLSYSPAEPSERKDFDPELLLRFPLIQPAPELVYDFRFYKLSWGPLHTEYDDTKEYELQSAPFKDFERGGYRTVYSGPNTEYTLGKQEIPEFPVSRVTLLGIPHVYYRVREKPSGPWSNIVEAQGP